MHKVRRARKAGRVLSKGLALAVPSCLSSKRELASTLEGPLQLKLWLSS
jgi:hypothetical protein